MSLEITCFSFIDRFCFAGTAIGFSRTLSVCSLAIIIWKSRNDINGWGNKYLRSVLQQQENLLIKDLSSLFTYYSLVSSFCLCTQLYHGWFSIVWCNSPTYYKYELSVKLSIIKAPMMLNNKIHKKQLIPMSKMSIFFTLCVVFVFSSPFTDSVSPGRSIFIDSVVHYFSSVLHHLS